MGFICAKHGLLNSEETIEDRFTEGSMSCCYIYCIKCLRESVNKFPQLTLVAYGKDDIKNILNEKDISNYFLP